MNYVYCGESLTLNSFSNESVNSVSSAPENVKNVTVLEQNETSITLKWGKVNDIPTYILQYDNSGFKEEIITESPDVVPVTHVVSSLTSGTKYDFTLITTSEGLTSTGYNFSAPTGR